MTGALSATLSDVNLRLGDLQPAYNALVSRLRAVGAGAAAPAIGDMFTDFALPDATGRFHTLSSLVASGPIVLSFHRGEWCPYCRAELAAWADAGPALAACGARFVAVSAELHGVAAATAGRAGDRAIGLCDVDFGVSLAAGLAIHTGFDLLEAYRSLGDDLQNIVGSRSGLLPIPATFVIGPDRQIRYAYVELDFRLRPEPMAVLAALQVP